MRKQIIIFFVFLSFKLFTYGQETYRVNASQLNVRKFPDKNSEIQRKLKLNDLLKIDTIISGWGKLSGSDSEFINMEFLSSDLNNKKVTATKEVVAKKEEKNGFFTNFMVSFFLSWFGVAYFSWNKTKKDARFSSGHRITQYGLGFGCLLQIGIAIIIALIYSFYKLYH
jgi:hypothetical protein